VCCPPRSTHKGAFIFCDLCRVCSSTVVKLIRQVDSPVQMHVRLSLSPSSFLVAVCVGVERERQGTVAPCVMLQDCHSPLCSALENLLLSVALENGFKVHSAWLDISFVRPACAVWCARGCMQSGVHLQLKGACELWRLGGSVLPCNVTCPLASLPVHCVFWGNTYVCSPQDFRNSCARCCLCESCPCR
jgi:hypothetical protein